jgi:hypothetical protein
MKPDLLGQNAVDGQAAHELLPGTEKVPAKQGVHMSDHSPKPVENVPAWHETHCPSALAPAVDP